MDAAPIIEEIRTIDERRRATQRSLDDALAEQNKLSKEIGTLMKEGKKDLAEEAKNKVAQLKETTKELEVTKKDLEDKLHGLIVQLPNVPSPEVPEGKTADDNVIEKTGGVMPQLDKATMLPHWELAKNCLLYTSPSPRD